LQDRLVASIWLPGGTLTQTKVCRREVVNALLGCDASAVQLGHNHPSRAAEASRANEFRTQTLETALGLVSVRVLDHLAVADAKVASFAARGFE
jgi:DNA repair protein RadC